jgi:trimeric autotransporter adhesin
LGTSPTYTTAALTSTASYCVLVTDSVTGTAQATATVTVNTALVALLLLGSPTAVDVGQPALFSNPSSSFSGGTAPYTCQPLAEVPGSSTFVDFGPSFSCAPGPISGIEYLTISGVWSFEFQVTDSSETPVTVTSDSVTVTVNPALTVSVPPQTIDTGQTATLTASPSGGSGTYSSYAWYLTSCTGGVLGTSASYTTAALTSTASYCVLVTDSVGGNATTTATVTVNSALVAAVFGVSPTTVDSGQTVTFSNPSSSFSGGTAPYKCQVLGEAPGASSFSAFSTPFTCAPGPLSGRETVSGTGVWSFELQITDSSSTPVSVTSNAVMVTVNPALTVSVPPQTIDTGQTATLTASPSGGSGTYSSYAWYLTTCTGTVLGTLASYTTAPLASMASYCALATDSIGGTAQATVTVTVNTALTAPAISASPMVDDGEPSTLITVTPFSGGTSTYACQWLEEAPGASSYSDLGAPFACRTSDTPTLSTGALSTPGTWHFELQVTDSSSSPVTVTSVAEITVSGSSTLTVSVAPQTIDTGQAAILTASPSGGSGTYSSYAWYLTSCTGTVLGTSASLTTASLTSTTSYCVEVSDSLGGTAQGTATVTVNTGLAVHTAPTPSASSIRPDQALSVTGIIPSTGTAPYSWTWMVSINGGGYATATQCDIDGGSGAIAGDVETCSIPGGVLTPGDSYTFELSVTDSAATPEAATSPASSAVAVIGASVSSISLSSSTGPVGSSITVTGSGFAAASSITITYDGSAVSTDPETSTFIVTTSTFGGFTLTFSVPASTAGAHTVQASDGTNSPTATFTVTPIITVAPPAGAAGTTVTLTGSGFADSSPVTATWDGAPLTLLGTATTDGAGAFSVTFTVPSTSTTANTVSVADSASNTASAQVNVPTGTAASTTTLNCNPSSLVGGSSTTCTATVIGSSPTGYVTFIGSSGTFSPDAVCAVITSGTLTGECFVTYLSESSAGTPTITAYYSGDSSNSASSGTTNLSVTQVPQVAIALTCNDSSILVSSATVCTAIVAPTLVNGEVVFATSNSIGFLSLTPVGEVSIPTNQCEVILNGTALQCAVDLVGAEVGHVSVTATIVGQSSSFIVDVTGFPSNSEGAQGSGTASGSISAVDGGSSAQFGLGGSGMTVSVSNTGAPAGTIFSAVGQTLNFPDSLVTTTTTLASPRYFDLSVGGITTGTVTFCVPDNAAAAGTTMQYYPLLGGPWTAASNVKVNIGVSVCGDIPVSALTGGGRSNIAVGSLSSGGGGGGGGGGFPSTSVSFTCSSSAATVGSFVICTFTMTSAVGAPSGAVSFSSSPQSAALGLQTSCSLVATSSTSASCSIAIGPTPGSAYASYTLTGSYRGDLSHAAASGTVALAVQDSTSTTITCSPSAVAVGSSTTCAATVKDTVTPAFTPTTFVFFSGPSSLGSSVDSSCILVSGTCSITLTPSSAGTFAIYGQYVGDSTHAGSEGSAVMTGSASTTNTTSTTSTTTTSTSTSGSSTTTTTTTSTTRTSSSSGSSSSSSNTTSTTTSTSTSTFSVSPSSGPSGTAVTISGSGLGANTTYSYCFESGAKLASVVACPAGSPSFTTNPSGNIPQGVILTPTGQTGVVVISNRATGAVVEAQQFTMTTVASSAHLLYLRLLVAVLAVGSAFFIAGWRLRRRTRKRSREFGGASRPQPTSEV